jgi:hypothetical protein
MFYQMNRRSDTDVQWLEYELERYRDEERRRIDQEIEQMQAERRQRRQRAEQRLRTAATWPQAIRNQSALCWREHQRFPDDPEEEGFFGNSAKACERALVLWTEEEAKVAEEIQTLRARIQALQDSIRFNVGHRLAAESDADGWQEVAETLQDKEADMEGWLYW